MFTLQIPPRTTELLKLDKHSAQ